MRNDTLTDPNAFDATANAITTRIPARLERAVVGSILWLVAALAFVIILVVIGFCLEQVGTRGKMTEFWLGASFLPTYFLVRHVWQQAYRFLLPTVFDLPALPVGSQHAWVSAEMNQSPLLGVSSPRVLRA